MLQFGYLSKTYEKDGLSLLRDEDTLTELIGAGKYESLKDYLEKDKNRKVAARWIARGLLPHDAFRKVLVDRKIAENAAKIYQYL